ncbi:MAG: hypothetical protein FJ164_14245 [Gammaproteobacteria bacterium]|nr:hypothetical protein [Gammaproteobacteria bacterium]
MPEHPIPSLKSLRGLWTRSLITWPDGRCDTDTEVRWLQGPSLYIDLRQPARRPDFSGVRGFRDLDATHLEWLVRQEGFAGRLSFDGAFFEWGRDIDLQPIGVYSDAGRLWLEPGRMVEEGRDVAYLEHWHCQDAALMARANDRCYAARLRRLADERDGFLVCVDGLFMFAKARPLPLPRANSLAECLQLAVTREQRDAWLDCEISFGTLVGSAFEIQHSSLPWREGTHGEMVLSDDALLVGEAGQAGRSEWRIIEAEGESTVLAA